MRNRILLFTLLFSAIIIGMASCDKKETVSTTSDPSFGEEFDTLSNAVKRGWVIKNNSKPIGTLSWVQGFYYISLSHDFDSKLGASNTGTTGGFGGTNPSYSGADFVMTTAECGHGLANLSNWLISPAVLMKNGDEISFYTRTYQNPAVQADRLEVRINALNSGTDIGTDSSSVGNFTQVILDINPDYLLEGLGSYPGEWTKYTATVSGLPSARKSRFAFRYYVPNGGPQGSNSQAVGIDKFSFISK
jgi:hypothetical protein